ncbi:MAG: hypothetical protein Q9220_005683 [cf. Caloplaca sp. 1 TL-2023]
MHMHTELDPVRSPELRSSIALSKPSQGVSAFGKHGQLADGLRPKAVKSKIAHPVGNANITTRLPGRYGAIPKRHQGANSQLLPENDVRTSSQGSHSTTRQGSNSRRGASGDTYSKGFKVPLESKNQLPIKHLSKSSGSFGPFLDTAEALGQEQRQIQSQLLQLHVVHSASAEVHAQWRDSAKRQFQQRFEVLADRHKEIADIVHQSQELKNQAALLDWCHNAQGSDTSKKIQTLSKSINEVCEILNPCGKYEHVIGSFEAWFNQAHMIREARNPSSATAATRSANIEEIGTQWQDDVSALQWKLSILTGELRTLGSASMSSNLGQLLCLLQDFVMDCLAELDCLRNIECEIIAQEHEWHENQDIRSSPKRIGRMTETRKTPKKMLH